MSQFKMAAYNFYGSQRNNINLTFNILLKTNFVDRTEMCYGKFHIYIL